jgi:hypothetical protein
MITLTIGDIHEPFGHKKYCTFIQRQVDRWKPDRILSIGDEVDQCALGNYDTDPDGMSAGDELKQAIAAMQKWYKAFPHITVVESNHGLRPFKKAFKAGLPQAYLRGYHEFLQAPKGWKWVEDEDIDGVHYFHGEPFLGETAALKAAKSHRQSVVIGHVHCHGGVMYSETRTGRIFGLNVGCGIDETRYAFKYSKRNASKATLGCGVVIDGEEAYFIPMQKG